jgi:hypothetical protein
MTLAGMAIMRVGLRPLQRVKTPSFRAIFRRPSSVEFMVRRCVSSAAQSEAAADMAGCKAAVEGLGAATQNCEEFCTQKTSRQQALTPRSGGSWMKEGRRMEGDGDGLGWACRRTRTTSRGVTVKECQWVFEMVA